MQVLFQWLRRFARWLTGLFHKAPAQPKESPPPNAPVPPEPSLQAPSSQITFYTVYIPTLDGRFFYLGIEDYAPGDIVMIPFGPEDRQIFGIVEAVQLYRYGKTPLPMWKMKYILGKAPQAVTEQYQKLQKG